MSNVVNNNFITVDNIAAGLATAASYKLAKNIFMNAGVSSYFKPNLLMDIGVKVTSACFGLWVGSKVREKTRKVRNNLSTFKKEDASAVKEEVQKQAKDLQNWMNSVD